MENPNYTYSYKRGEEKIHPAHKTICNWAFESGEEAEANLADAMARVAEKNGMTANDLMHLFPAVLRMLKSESRWAK
jgi:uncharacterized protein (DUF2267 family)